MATAALMREFKDIKITVPWGHINGRWYGNTKIRPILAIHGWLDNIGTWDKLIQLLPQHIAILCIDLPGHGQSSHYPKGMSYHIITDYVQIIIRIVKEYHWRKVSLMGHSLGAVISFLYAALYPQNVDLLIAIDMVKLRYHSINSTIARFAYNVENLILANDYDHFDIQEPPTHTYAELENMLYDSSLKSINFENCKYLLNNDITKSLKYPDKYYISHDERLKFHFEYFAVPEFIAQLAKRIHDIPYFVVKGTKSNFIKTDSMPVIDILRQNNPNFEFHVFENGTHHLHLNNALELSLLLNPFLQRHWPAIVNSGSTEDVNENWKDTLEYQDCSQNEKILKARNFEREKIEIKSRL